MIRAIIKLKKEDVWVSAHDEQRKRVGERTLKYLSKILNVNIEYNSLGLSCRFEQHEK